MLYLDFEADTEKEATQLALDSLGLDIEDVTIKPLIERKKNFFGLGKKEKTKIRVYYKEKSEINDIIYTVKTIISKLDKNSFIETESETSNRYILRVESTDSGRLIGKNGRAIEAIQRIINAILQKYESKYKIIVDVDNYNERQMSYLLSLAQRTAKQVQKTRKPLTLKAMNPFQRRLIHLEVQKMKGVTTKSNGDGKLKTITISYENGNRTSYNSRTRGRHETHQTRRGSTQQREESSNRHHDHSHALGNDHKETNENASLAQKNNSDDSIRNPHQDER